MIIKDGNIFHKRGDTADIEINLTVDGVPPETYQGIFSIKQNLKESTYLLQKDVVDGHIRINHTDTQFLPFGDFYYDIQIKLNDGTPEGRYLTIGPYRYYLRADVTTN